MMLCHHIATASYHLIDVSGLWQWLHPSLVPLVWSHCEVNWSKTSFHPFEASSSSPVGYGLATSSNFGCLFGVEQGYRHHLRYVTVWSVTRLVYAIVWLVSQITNERQRSRHLVKHWYVVIRPEALPFYWYFFFNFEFKFKQIRAREVLAKLN